MGAHHPHLNFPQSSDSSANLKSTLRFVPASSESQCTGAVVDTEGSENDTRADIPAPLRRVRLCLPTVATDYSRTENAARGTQAGCEGVVEARSSRGVPRTKPQSGLLRRVRHHRSARRDHRACHGRCEDMMSTRIADPIERGEASAERWYEEMTKDVPPDHFRCGCGRVTHWNDAHPYSANPYSPPICGACLESAPAATMERT